MNIKFLLFLIAFLVLSTSFGQTLNKVGFMGNYDLAYNFTNKFTKADLGRKLSVGVYGCYKNKFILFGGVSFKLSRYGFLSPKLNDKFLKDYRENYSPYPYYSLDSVLGAGLNGRANGGGDHYSIEGTTSSSFHFGFSLNTKFKPTIQFYTGKEKLEFYIFDIDEFYPEDNYDLNYTGIRGRFNEIKLGISLLPNKVSLLPYSFSINLGYKWYDYGTLSIGDSPLSSFTNGFDFSEYSKSGKLTLSLSVTFLSFKEN